MIDRDELIEHEREERLTQIAMYRALTPSERLTAAMAFCRSVLAMTPAVDLRGTVIDREREAAKERIERAFGPRASTAKTPR